MAVQVFDDGPGDRQAIIGAGAAPDLVQDHQAAWSGIVEDVGCLDHFHHKGGLPGMDGILSADARKHAVHQADFSTVGGHKAANLRH